RLTHLYYLYNKFLCSDNKLIFHSQSINQIGIYSLDFIKKYQIKLNESLGASYQDNGLWFQIYTQVNKMYFLNEAFYMLRRDNPNSSIYSKEKVYAICEEYDYIRNFLNEKPELNSFLPYATFFRYRNYIFTLDRIDDKYKLDFIKRFAKDFKEILEKNELDFTLFEESDIQKIKFIIKDPQAYYLNLNNVFAENTIYFGAAQRIKSQLSYRIGSFLLSKSLTKIVKIPYEVVKYKFEKKVYDTLVKFYPHLKLPRLEEYLDYNEALKTKEHLSYRLGNALIKNPFTFIFKIKKIYRQYKNRFNFLNIRLEDNEFLLQRHRDIFGYTPDFKNPKTFNEKLIYRILYDRSPIYSFLADKLKMRIYVNEILNREKSNYSILDKDSILFKKIDELQEELFKTNSCKYLPKLYAIYKDLYEIDFSKLPNSFVLKTNHDCGGYVIVENKQKFLRDTKVFSEAMEKLKKHLNWNYYDVFREWHYKNIEPRIFAEELLLAENKKPADTYKFHIFDKRNMLNNYIQVTTDRFDDYQRVIYDYNWKLAPFNFMYELENVNEIAKPELFDLMMDISLKLSYPFDYVRVDLYQPNKQIYIGELTFTHGAAGEKLVPNKWDKKLGDLWKLKRLSDATK
ncbi:ATP-grasp fold amidoligase family protein, partial [Campylobacter novaezeelandiae]